MAHLVRLAQEGDREAFGRLATQFERTVYNVALNRLGNPSEAAELTQEVFLHVLRRIDQLREPERFAGWIRQMTDRMAINRATRRAPLPSIDQEILQTATQGRPAPLDEMITRERADRLREALAQLKPIYRDALVAFYIRELSLVEIAEELDVPVGTVKRRLHTARKMLKETLEDSVHDHDEWSDPSEDPYSEPVLAGAGV